MAIGTSKSATPRPISKPADSNDQNDTCNTNDHDNIPHNTWKMRWKQPVFIMGKMTSKMSKYTPPMPHQLSQVTKNLNRHFSKKKWHVCTQWNITDFGSPDPLTSTS